MRWSSIITKALGCGGGKLAGQAGLNGCNMQNGALKAAWSASRST
jgi:hypothetical protein